MSIRAAPNPAPPCPAGVRRRSAHAVVPHCIIETGAIRLDSPGSVSDHLIAIRAIIRVASKRSPDGTSHNAERTGDSQ
ncbi:hypothetical protein [Burkholderia stagnalis]